MTKRTSKATTPHVLTSSKVKSRRLMQGKAFQPIELFKKAYAAHQEGNLAEAEKFYIAAIKIQPDHFDAIHLLGALKCQQKQYEEAYHLISSALKLNSGLDSAWANHGIAQIELGRYEGALGSLNRALALNPAAYKALNSRGHTLALLDRHQEALIEVDKAIALQPHYFDALNNRSAILLKLDRSDEALIAADTALSINPRSVNARINRASALRSLFRLNEAITAYEEALSWNAKYAELSVDESIDAYWNLSLTALLAGNFVLGWKTYEFRWQWKRFTSPIRNFPQPLWLGNETIEGKRILLHSEQGFGDTLQFCRYVKLVADLGAMVFLEVPAALKNLLAGLAGVSCILGKNEPLPNFDFHCPLMSLPLAFNTLLENTPADVPYLQPDPKLVVKWECKLGEKQLPRIGIAWSGNPNHAQDEHRSISLERFLKLRAENIQFVSLQRDVRSEDLELLTQHPSILHFGHKLADFSDTAALVQSMDLVITVDTSIAHLAGALGKPVWILIPHLPDWRWLTEREDSPWYPSARLFRQPSKGDWDSVLHMIRGELEVTANNMRNKSPHVAAITPPATKATEAPKESNSACLPRTTDRFAQIVAQHIPDGAVVLDIGCGEMTLERYLPPNCTYLPCDLVQRDSRTILCTFDKGEFPHGSARTADVISLLGAIEFIVDVSSFFKLLRGTNCDVVLTYSPTDLTKHIDRTGLGWVNHLSNSEIADLFINSGFTVKNIEKLNEVQLLFKLSPLKRAQIATKKVAVLSYANIGNFGDRLGYHLLQSVLPSNAIVEHYFFKPWSLPDLSGHDLLVLGIGNSLFAPLLTDELQCALEQVPRAIGIFGTQYRSAIDRRRLERVIQKLDRWYARHSEDIFLFGQHAHNAVHFGDWLIDAFPLSTPTIDEPLMIGKEIWKDLPLDRTIQQIQKHKRVISTRLHPLLCALTSAETVQYTEQRESPTGEESGKFRSMLIDIFGRAYPENIAWTVDRRKVAQYKEMVSENIKILRDDINHLLNGSPEIERGDATKKLFPDTQAPSRNMSVNILSGCTKLRFNSHLNHACYAAKHGYGYRFDITPRKLASVFDHKIFSILDCPIDGNWYFWIDDDAFFTQFDRPFTDLNLALDESRMMIFPKSPINPLGGWTYLSSGNFFFRSTPETHAFFRRVLETDISAVKKWWNSTQFGIFTNGDQDRIVYCLMQDKSMLELTDVVSWDIFNYRPYHFEMPSSHFLVHFAVPNVSKESALNEFKTRFQFADDSLIPSKFYRADTFKHFQRA